MIKPHRPLKPVEYQIAAGIFKAVIGDDVKVLALIRELVVHRETAKVLRGQRRCLPRHAQEALDGLPHHHSTAVEFPHN